MMHETEGSKKEAMARLPNLMFSCQSTIARRGVLVGGRHNVPIKCNSTSANIQFLVSCPVSGKLDPLALVISAKAVFRD
jgi:hypothetical protein